MRGMAAALLVATWWIGPAHAGIVVLHGPDVDAAQASILAKDQLGTGDLRVAGPLSEWIGAEGDAAVLVGAEGRRCTESKGQDKRGLAGNLLPLRDQMMEMSYDDAILRGKLLSDRLPCLASDASQDDIYELLFTLGVANYFAGDVPAAKEAFVAAAAIDPSRGWPRRYPPAPKETYLDALRQVVAEPPANVVSELEGPLLLDGLPSDGKPRLTKGGHLLWAEESKSALWVDVASPGAFPDGLLVTTADKLAAGLITGEERYAAWLIALAKKEGWDKVALVSASWTILLADGEFKTVKADARALRRAAAELKKTKGPRPMAWAGVVMGGAGLALAGIGTGLNMDSYRRAIPQVGQPLMSEDDYAPLHSQNQAGLGLAIGGGVTTVSGIVVALVGLALPPPKLAIAPSIQSDGQTMTFGIGGELP